ncbi:hypothetical protein PR202_ga17589 [Eleusine coracana subsp. coracana]|uniref:Uncharacterized protein n=1 Tax=Eleusine coracana subsp. coracana TaxID=191504 RepID=A0AAV5CQH5_ELECO|nr:hypothetical protein PR202_ga17342 [Eleusine coracana subsp. coracana]GJN00408.1 hypothetical protein PR202_ga17589 [Eleusine coracana subsp. coracana]
MAGINGCKDLRIRVLSRRLVIRQGPRRLPEAARRRAVHGPPPALLKGLPDLYLPQASYRRPQAGLVRVRRVRRGVAHQTTCWPTAAGTTLFVSTWAELARTGALPARWRPNHDRSVFWPRAVPSYSASLAEGGFRAA